MRRPAWILPLLCLVLLSPATARADDARLVFTDALLVLFSGEAYDLPVPKARADGKTKALTSRQKDALGWKWSKDGAELPDPPVEPGVYTLTATCVRSGSTLLAPAVLTVALLPPADSVIQVDAPLILARLQAALDTDKDGKITCREAAAATGSIDLSGLDLTAVPQELFMVMPRVKALNLSQNTLTALPEGGARLLSLETLDLSENPIELLEAGFPDSLKVLDLHSCALDLEGTPEAERIAALREKSVDVRSEGQVPRCVYLPVHLEPVELAVGERYRDPGFRWQTIRGNAVRVTAQAPPEVETLLIGPDGGVSACRYDRLVFDAPGAYELSYTLDGNDVGSRRITVTGSPLPTAPPVQEAVGGNIQVVVVPTDAAGGDGAGGGGMSRVLLAGLLGLGCVGAFLVGVMAFVRPRFVRMLWERVRKRG